MCGSYEIFNPHYLARGITTVIVIQFLAIFQESF